MSASKIFKSLFKKQRLIDVFSDHIAGSAAVGLDRIRPIHFQKNLTSEVSGICERVMAGTYKFTSFKQKLISKGANSLPRVISIPTVRDRITLRVLCDFLNTSTPLRAIDSTVESLMRRFSLIGKIKVKSLVKSFYETKRRNKVSHKYIPNFDHMTVEEKRLILSRFLVSSDIAYYSDERINSLFKMRIGALVKEMEKDIQGFS